jgi:hypothetical protein
VLSKALMRQVKMYVECCWQGGGEKRKRVFSKKTEKTRRKRKVFCLFFLKVPIQKGRKLFSEKTEKTWRKRKRKGTVVL